MKDAIEFIVKSIVDLPEEVKVNEKIQETETIYEIHVETNDLGKIIGKQGKVIKAIRTLAKASILKSHKNTRINIID